MITNPIVEQMQKRYLNQNVHYLMFLYLHQQELLMELTLVSLRAADPAKNPHESMKAHTK